MVFKKKEALDLLQKKEVHFSELVSESDTALRMVHDTIENLAVINQDIESTVEEIDTYLKRLHDTRAGLSSTFGRNQKIMRNFSKLLCLDD